MKSNFFGTFFILCVFLLPNCSDEREPVKPYIDYILTNRTVAYEPGKVSFTDDVDMKIRGDGKTRIVDYTGVKSEASWAVPTVTFSTLSGKMAVRPVITHTNNGLTFDYGAFKVVDAVRFIGGIIEGDTPAYGFIEGKATNDATFASNSVKENGKNYIVTTVTQKFEMKHSDGTFTDKQTIVFKCKTEFQGEPVHVEEISRTTIIDRSLAPIIYESAHLFRVDFSCSNGTSAESYFELLTKSRFKGGTNSFVVNSFGITEDDIEIEELYGVWNPDELGNPGFTDASNYEGPVQRTVNSVIKLGSAPENRVVTFEWEDIAYRLKNGQIIDLSEPTWAWSINFSVNSKGDDHERSGKITIMCTFGDGDLSTILHGVNFVLK